MRKIIYVLFLLILTPGLLAAQTNSTPASTAAAITSTQPAKEYRGHGYVFVAPGVVTSGSTATLHFGGGGEGLIRGGFSAGAEIGGLVPVRDFSEGFGILSADAGYHFLKASQSGKVVPFVNGGYTLFFRSGVANGVNFGGGVNYWFKERVGLRFEVRDHVAVEIPETHFIGFRIGLTFR